MRNPRDAPDVRGAPPDDESSSLSFARRALTVASIAAGVVIVALLLWSAADVLLLVFAAVLLAIFLRGLSDMLSRHTNLSAGWSLAVVTLSLVAIFAGAVWLLTPRVSTQVEQFSEYLPRAVERLRVHLDQYGWGRRLIAEAPNITEIMAGRTGVLARATGIFSGVLGGIVNVLIVIFVGLYLTAEPRLYINGLVRLVPISHRPRVLEVLGALGHTLRRWLVGRLILMLLNGVLTTLALWLLGVPLALTLGILAGLLNFIPNIGPVIAGIPAVLIALMQSPTQALYVFILYVALQSVDGYLLTPLVQRRTVDLPPVLTITAQVLLGVLLGTLGVLLATPLTAATLVLVRMLYVEDTLGDSATTSVGKSGSVPSP
ncbi:MAG: AI-2E family transporter [Pyrinomonadaceae bacterium]